MKLTKSLSVMLAACVCAATIGVGSAYAQELPDETYYPESFLCSLSINGELTDYAVYGDSYAFAYSGQLAVLSDIGNNQRLPYITAKNSITQLEYSAEGDLFVYFADGYCVYPDLDTKYDLSGIEVQNKDQYLVTVDGASYALDKNSGSMLYLDGGITPVTLQQSYEGEVRFSKLKAYNDTAYAVMDNCLYKMEGATAVKIDPTYYGYEDMTKSIATGNAAQALLSDSPITYGWIELGKYYTEISLKEELGSTFKISNPATDTTLSEDWLYCMVLAESGNAYIVTIGGKCYLTAKTSVSIVTETATITPAETQAAYAIQDTGIYSRPYISAATKICVLESGSANAVTVLGQFTDLNGIEYYKIKYVKDDGSTVTGYIAKKFMTPYAFQAEDEQIHTDGGDSEFVYDTNVVTVILAVSIVALVLIAVLYVAIATSANSRKKKKKRQQQSKKKNVPKERRKNRYDDDDYYDDDEDYDD